MIGADGFCKLVDFGQAKRLTDGRTYTFCGTLEYISPEMHLKRGYGESVDLWSLGIVIYEMLMGFTPFVDSNPQKMFDKILKEEPKYEDCPEDAVFLIKGLLEKNPQKRLGMTVEKMNPLKECDFFQDIDFKLLMLKLIDPPVRTKKL